MKLKEVVIRALVFALLIGSYGYAQKITDIIKPLRLVSGQTGEFMISDIYYAKDYKVKFGENKNLKVEYNQKDSILKVTTASDFEGITLLPFEYNKTTYQIPVVAGKQRFHTFKYKPLKPFKHLTVIGQFNAWNRQYDPMTDPDGDGVYEIAIPVEPGRYEYKFFGDGQEIVDPSNKDSVPNGMGAYNSVIIIEKPFKSSVFLHNLGMKESKSFNIYHFIFEKDGQPLPVEMGDVSALLDNELLKESEITIEKGIIKVTLPRMGMKGTKLLRVAVTKEGQKSNWQYIFLQDGMPAGEGKFSWYDGIIYSIVTDRFNDGDKSINKPVKHDSVFTPANYQGGDFQGIINKLNDGYFEKLGINTIWISPVNDNPITPWREYPAPNRWYTGYHGYWPISDTKVEEQFGSMAKLRELVKTAHKKGIKVLLDFVSHHVHQEHPWFKKHPDWFGTLDLPDGRKNLRLWDEFRLTTWFEPYIPSFDFTKSKKALEAVSENAIWWLEQTGADGYRHDAVKHVPNEFWRVLTAKIKKHFAGKRDIEVYQIGETFGDYAMISSYVNNGQLSSQFNFNLFDVAIVAFLNKDASMELIATELKKTEEVYGPLHLMGNIMDSHDKIRYMAYADGDLEINDGRAAEIGWNNPPKVDDPASYDKLKLYYAYMMTIPGLPVVYYGSEFGMTGASDPDNRRMMYFDDKLNELEKKTKGEVIELIKLRNRISALRYGDLYPIYASKNVLGYIRSDVHGRVLVLLNKSMEEQSVELDLPKFYDTGYIENPLTKERVIPQADHLRLKIPPSGYEIFILGR
ncbi:MAG: hypothetical protein AMXMBFR49_26050 [Chlorobiota bacterium]